MLNLSDISGVASSPISKSVLENSIGNSSLKNSRAYANYENFLSQLSDQSYKAPSIIFASGNGSYYPTNTSSGLQFYSSFILGRDKYLNNWQLSHRIDDIFELSYFDGSTVFNCLSIDPSNQRIKTRSLETRNGNKSTYATYSQLIFGYDNTASTTETGIYRHNIRTRHDPNNNMENAIDVFLWNTLDSNTALGSRRVLSLYGNGNEELVSGFRIDGGINVDISTPSTRTSEQTNYALSGKGVIYFNTSVNKYRYSENGGAFKYLGSGSGGGSGIIQSCDLNQCGPYSELLVDKPIAIMMHSVGDLSINKISIATMVGSTDGINIGLAIYKPSVNTNTLSGIALTKAWSGTVTTTVNEEMLIATIGDNDVVTVNGWYSILITNMNANNNPVIAAYVNQTQMLDDTPSIAYQLDASSAISNGTWVSTFTPNNILNTEIVPYIKIGGASDSDSQSSDTYKVKLTSSDNTEDYIENKLSAGTNVTIGEVIENGIKKLKINSTASASGGGTSAANNKIAVLANPCADDDIILFYATEAVNINSMILLMRSTDETITQSIAVSIYKVNARNAISSATPIVSGTVSDFATGTTLSVNSALISGNMLILKVTTVVGSPILLETITTFGSSLT